jgi:hypothetical protein
MRAPPPVEFTSAPGRAWRAALALLAHGGGRQPDALSDALGNPLVQAALAVWVAAMVVAVFWLASQRAAANERTLRWDGQDWVLAAGPGGGPDRRGDAALMLDLGPWMLVRFLPHASTGVGAGIWLPLTAAGDLARWAALRGALWNWRSQRAGRP